MLEFINKTAFFAGYRCQNDTCDSLLEMSQLTLNFLCPFSAKRDINKAITKFLNQMKNARFVIGQYLAVPHVRLSILEKPKSGFFTIPEGLIGDPLDNSKVYFCWLMFFPDSWNNEFLKTIGILEYIFRDVQFRKNLLSIKSNFELYRFMKQHLKQCEIFKNKADVGIPNSNFILPGFYEETTLFGKLLIKNRLGLHARPASSIVNAYYKWNLNYMGDIYFVSADSKKMAYAGNLMDVMCLCCEYGDELDIHGINCSIDDIRFFLSGFNAIEESEAYWIATFDKVYG